MAHLHHNDNADLRARQLADSGIVEVRRSRFLMLVSRLTRRSRPEAEGDESEHFHADRVEDVSSLIILERTHFLEMCGFVTGILMYFDNIYFLRRLQITRVCMS